MRSDRLPGGKPESYRRSLADFGLDLQLATVPFDDPEGHCEAEAGSLTFGLGGEERIADSLQLVIWNRLRKV